MELLLPSLAMCIAGLVVGAFSLVSRRQDDLKRSLRALAERLRLPLDELTSQMQIRGKVAGFDVESEATESGFNEPREMARISIRGGGIPRSLTIGVTDAWTVLGRLF